jgi:hypothetical protein
MSDIKIFRLESSGAVELKGQSVALEKSLQTLIEKKSKYVFMSSVSCLGVFNWKNAWWSH